MKKIELTPEHRQQIKDMTIVLFPEYAVGMQGDNVILGNGIDEEPIHTIHWFEFCMRYLAGRLTDGKTFYEYCSRCMAQNHLELQWDSELSRRIHTHPVNYLYEKFKQL